MLLSSCVYFLIQITFHITLKEIKKGRGEVLCLIFMVSAFLNVIKLHNELVMVFNPSK